MVAATLGNLSEMFPAAQVAWFLIVQTINILQGLGAAGSQRSCAKLCAFIMKKKRKNPGVGVDFKRVKSKVGRKLKRANETKTDYTVKSINLPSQNLKTESLGGSGDENDTVLTKRMVSMADLIRQCRHYSPKIRLNAVQGMLELLQAHDVSRTGQSLSQVLQCALECLVDSTGKVRKVVLQVLVALFRSPGGPSRDHQHKLKPFVPLLLVHVFKAMTHLSHDVSVDGIEALSSMLSHLGVALSQQDDRFFRRLEGNFNAILTQLFAETTNVEARSKFVAKLVACVESSLELCRSRPGGRGGELLADGEGRAAPAPGTWSEAVRRRFPNACGEFSRLAGDEEADLGVQRQEAELFFNLRRLLGIFKVHFSGDGEEGDDRRAGSYVEIARRVTSCLRLLLETHPDLDASGVEEVLRETSSAFPVEAAGAQDGGRREDVLAYNANCVGLLLACVARLGGEGSEGPGRPCPCGVLDSMWGLASRDLRAASRGGAALVGAEGESRFRMLASSSVRMLRFARAAERAAMCCELCEILEGSEDLEAKRILLQAAFAEDDYLLRHCSDADRTRWLQVIPKMIWEAHKRKDWRTCDLGSRVLLKILQCTPGLGDAERDTLQLQLVPTFAIQMGKGTMWGPFVSLGRTFQSDMASILYYLSPLSDKVVKSATACALNPDVPEGACIELLYALTTSTEEGKVSSRVHFLSSLLLESCRKQTGRAETVVQYVCTCLRTTFVDRREALLSLLNRVTSTITKPSVPLLCSLVRVFGEVAQSINFEEEGSTRDLCESITSPLAFVLLKWATSEVKEEKPNQHAARLESMWSAVRRATFLVPPLIGLFGSYMAEGSFSLRGEVQLLEAGDVVLRSCAISTVLYEMVKENLVAGAGKGELRTCLDTIEHHNKKMAFSKFVYLRDSFV